MITTKSTLALASCCAALALAACAVEKPLAGDSGSQQVSAAATAEAAIANPARLAGDSADDARRKPGEVLEFMQIAPGMAVFEIEAGGGWYTELLSWAVRPDGEVVMQNPEGFIAFVGEQLAQRFANGRLANVRRSISNFDELDADDGWADLATWVQGPHELYFVPTEGEGLGDVEDSFAEIYRVLKPGGAFVVVDHAAEAGAPASTGNDLHRIDKAIVIDLAQSAGFVLESETDILENPDDPLTNAVFDPSIRGYTSQFVLRFRKPA